MNTIPTLVPVTELQRGDVLPRMANAVVELVNQVNDNVVNVLFMEPVISPYTEQPRGHMLYAVTDRVHAVRPTCDQCGPGYRLGDDGCHHDRTQS